MLILLAVLTALFALALRYTVKALLVPDIPRWRRIAPLALLLTATAASLLRAVDIPEPASLIAFPCYIAAIALAKRGLRRHRTRTAVTD